jgi:hypothetical protein
MSRNLVGSIQDWSTVNIFHFDAICYQIWPPQAILVSEWLISKQSSVKPHGQLNRILV